MSNKYEISDIEIPVLGIFFIDLILASKINRSSYVAFISLAILITSEWGSESTQYMSVSTIFFLFWGGVVLELAVLTTVTGFDLVDIEQLHKKMV